TGDRSAAQRKRMWFPIMVDLRLQCLQIHDARFSEHGSDHRLLYLKHGNARLGNRSGCRGGKQVIRAMKAGRIEEQERGRHVPRGFIADDRREGVLERLKIALTTGQGSQAERAETGGDVIGGGIKAARARGAAFEGIGSEIVHVLANPADGSGICSPWMWSDN